MYDIYIYMYIFDFDFFITWRRSRLRVFLDYEDSTEVAKLQEVPSLNFC
jgi:hypothetical protein